MVNDTVEENALRSAANEYLNSWLREVAKSVIAQQTSRPLEELLSGARIEHTYTTRDGTPYVGIGGRAEPQTDCTALVRGIRPEAFAQAAGGTRFGKFMQRIAKAAKSNVALAVELDIAGVDRVEEFKGQYPLARTRVESITFTSVKTKKPIATLYFERGREDLPHWCSYSVAGVDVYWNGEPYEVPFFKK